tara:strand:+ start:416 stop:1018 length:603 start_codon:yes stop_codon:yes gene_type:complete
MIKTQNTLNTLGLSMAIVLMILLGGCADFQGALAQTTHWRDQAKMLETELQAQLETLETKQATIDPASPAGAFLETTIEQANEKIGLLNAAIAQADAVISEAQNPSDPLTVAAESLSPWVPAPIQGPLVLGAALAASLMRSRNLKQSAASIIQSIEHTLNSDPEFKQRFVENANTIRTIQTPGARRLIDRTVTKKPAIIG